MRTLYVILLFLLPLSLMAQTGQYKRAEPKATKSKNKASSEKVDIKNLEEQYWTPSDTEFKVVQNRKYSKEGKLGITAQLGIQANDPYTEGFGSLSFIASYYFTEFMGVEINYTDFNTKDSEIIDRFRGQFGGTTPNFALLDNYIGVNFNWVPIYGKMSILDNRIIYFDLAISPGIGMTTYEPQTQSGFDSQDALTLSLDIQQHFFFTEGWAIRLDMKNRAYTEDRIKYLDNSAQGDSDRLITLWQLGLTYYFDTPSFGKSKKKNKDKKK